MSTEQKVELVAEVREEYGLNQTLGAVELAKSTWYYWQSEKQDYGEKYEHLRAALEDIAQQWPEYGYRRTTQALRDEHGQVVNHKVVQRLHQEWEFALKRTTHRPKPSQIRKIIHKAGGRANLVADLDEIGMFEVLYTDFTEILYAGGQWKAHFMPILDHASRTCVGWGLGERANRDLALAAWQTATAQLGEWGLDPAGRILHHDQDSVYTSYRWTGQLLLEDRIRLSYSLSGAKDNPYIESFFSRFKQEGHSEFLDAQTIEELQEVIARRLKFYNEVRYHSALGYRAPLVFLQQQLPEQVIRLHI
jgi:putative transposase